MANGDWYTTPRKLSAITTSQGTTAFTYNATTGTLSALNGPGPVPISFTYDGALLKSIVCSGPVSGSVNWTLDSNFRITAEQLNGSNLSFAYDNDGLLTGAGSLTITRSPATGFISSTTLGSISDSRSYNAFGEINSYSVPSLFSVNFTRDAIGRIDQKAETIQGLAETYDYDYDLSGRLTDVRKNGSLIAHYDYDSNGNRVGGAYDSQDRLLQYGNFTYSYSANGDLQTKTDTSTGAITAYNYDELGNLQSANLPDNTLIEYVIDGANRRIGKKVNGALVQGFLYRSSLQITAELDSNINVLEPLCI